MMKSKPRRIDFSVLRRLLGMLYHAYPVLLPVTGACILFSSLVSALPAVFQQKVLADIGTFVSSGDWSAASAVILPKVVILGVLYLLSIGSIIAYTQLMAYITQGFLHFNIILARELGGILVFALKLDSTTHVAALNVTAHRRTLGLHAVLLLHFLHHILWHGLIGDIGDL